MSTQIILTLAQLLHQHSLDYESAKNSLLDTTASLALQVSADHAKHEGNDADDEASNHEAPEVHVILTGSPRPTFVETNAWLLEHGGRSRSNTADSIGSHKSSSSSCSCSSNSQQVSEMQHYIHDATEGSTPNANMNDLCGSPTKTGGSVLSHYRKSNKRNTAEDGADNHPTTTTTTQPLVGRAVVNAIAQTKGVGLQSTRAKLLQGTIDRPLWDQRRWTDGECLFSDLVERCGLESFACNPDNVANDESAIVPRKMSLSAQLITVPVNNNTTTQSACDNDDETIGEIARGILRLLKRKHCRPVSVVHLVLCEEERDVAEGIERQLKDAWDGLEKYNDLIGVERLLSGVRFEIVDA